MKIKTKTSIEDVNVKRKW